MPKKDFIVQPRERAGTDREDYETEEGSYSEHSEEEAKYSDESESHSETSEESEEEHVLTEHDPPRKPVAEVRLNITSFKSENVFAGVAKGEEEVFLPVTDLPKKRDYNEGDEDTLDAP